MVKSVVIGEIAECSQRRPLKIHVRSKTNVFSLVYLTEPNSKLMSKRTKKKADTCEKLVTYSNPTARIRTRDLSVENTTAPHHAQSFQLVHIRPPQIKTGNRRSFSHCYKTITYVSWTDLQI